jgi:hypothetical protein
MGSDTKAHFLAIFILVITLKVLLIITIFSREGELREIRREAVERGCAEWVVEDERAVWQWKEE